MKPTGKAMFLWPERAIELEPLDFVGSYIALQRTDDRVRWRISSAVVEFI